MLKIAESDLRSIIHIDKETRSGQLVGTCPFCGKEKHFYIDKKTQLFECKKCWTAGSIYKLLKFLDKTYLIGDKSIEYKEKIDSIRKGLEDELNKEVEEIKELPERKMPVGFKVCRNNDYLFSRGIGKKDCERYGIGETSLSFKYRNYILIPIYDNGVVRGFLGRYGAKKVPEDKLRYNNSLNTEFAELLFGYDEIVKNETETVIITEGVFDKISVDQKLGLWDDSSVKCVTTFGKKISDVQVNKLLLKNVTNVIMSWDYDALKEIKEYGIKLTKYFNVFVGISTKEKDLGDCMQDEVVDVYQNIKPIEEFTFDVIGKLKR
jgi:hypothetical protein